MPWPRHQLHGHSRPTVGSLFSGVGGLDLGLERAGFEVRWQIENDPYAVKVLAKHWPTVKRYGDIREVHGHELEPVDLLCGGDPCPYRSRAKSIWSTKHADLWPEFLRLVRILRPLWVLREHVVSPDADVCWAELVACGYTAVILDVNSAEVTGQSRNREYLLGVRESSGCCPISLFPDPSRVTRHSPSSQAQEPVSSCLTTHPQRYDSRDNYIHEIGRGVRILDAHERERLQGFPPGWTDQLSPWQRARVLGNAVTVPIAQWLGERILMTMTPDVSDA